MSFYRHAFLAAMSRVGLNAGAGTSYLPRQYVNLRKGRSERPSRGREAIVLPQIHSPSSLIVAMETDHPIPDRIIIRGARVHNLKDIDVDMPLNWIVGAARAALVGKGFGILAHLARQYVKLRRNGHLVG